MFDVKDTFSPLMYMFVAHDFVGVSIAVTIKGGNLASFKRFGQPFMTVI